jgi:hypothetical protein
MSLAVALSLDEHDCLRIGDFESCPAPGVRTKQHIVDPNHVIPGFGEFRPIEIAGAAGELRFLGPPQPANLKIVGFSTFRAGIAGGFRLLLFDVIVSFVHADSVHRKYRIS